VRFSTVITQIFGYYSNELLSVNTLHEHKLRNKSQMSEQPSLSIYRVYSMSADNILMCCCYYLMTMSVSGLWQLMNMEQLVGRELTGETEILRENLLSATLSIIYPIWQDLGLNPGCCCRKPSTNCLSYISWICEMYYTTCMYQRWLIVHCLCMLFVGDKCQIWGIIW
jgi:hypothetical protein